MWVRPKFFEGSLSESGFSGLIGIFRMAGDRLLSVGRIFLCEMKGLAAGRQRYGMNPKGTG